MYFEIFKQGNLIARGKEILNTLSIDNELMLAPSTTLILPIDWLEKIDGREEIKIYLDECRVFWGIVWDIVVDKVNETIELDVRHIITEWQYRQISVNHAISDNGENSSLGKLNIVYKGDKTRFSDDNDETITASDFTMSIEAGKTATNKEIIEKARASAWVTSNGDRVNITSVKVKRVTSVSPSAPANLTAWEEAMETQYEWSKHQRYYFATPTVETSKTEGTCITFVAVSLQRLELLSKGGYFFFDPNKGRIGGNRANYVLNHPEVFKVSYPNKTIAQLGSKIQVGDIVGYGNPNYHTMVFMGFNSKGQPIFNTMGHERGLRRTYSSYADRKVNMLVRLVGSKESEETTTDASLASQGTYKVTFSTKKGTSVTVTAEVVGSVDMKTRQTHSSKTNKETISAVPLTVYTDANLTTAQVKKKVDPKAWVYRHKNQSVTVTSVTTDYQNEVGVYHLTASTALGTSITVDIKVVAGNGGYSTLDDPAVIDQLEDIYTDMNFAYPGWEIDFQDDSGTVAIDYVYSRQNKLEALTQTMELTDNLWWRVGLWDNKLVQIGEFGEQKPYVLSTKPSGVTNIRIIEEPKIDYDFENVVNVATVYSDKSDGGMSSLTLREIYEDLDSQKKGFPVVILHANVNNERDYTKYISQYPQLAPNNEIEYAIIDEESVALESGTVIEGTYAFNDYSPFEIDGKRISNKKRKRAAKTVYKAVIKKLIQARRSYDVTVVTEPIPCDLEVGDKIRFRYDNKIWNMDACSNYWKKLLKYNDLFYVTKITYIYDEYGNLTNELTLTKWLKMDRETSNR